MPPSSPSRLIRVASGVSSTLAVRSAPIALTTFCTNAVMSVVRVSFTLISRPVLLLGLGCGGPSGTRLLDPTLRGRTCDSEGRGTNQPVREVLLTNGPQVADEIVNGQPARQTKKD